MNELTANPLVVSLLSLVAGACLTMLATAIRNKTSTFGYVSFCNRIGVSTDDEIYGAVRVSWEGHELRNLYSYTIEIENPTLRDYEGIEIDIYSSVGTILLNEKTEILDTPYIVLWKPAFRDQMTVPEGQEPTEQQFDIHRRRREYLLPVFNRWQKLRFTFLCTRPDNDDDPTLFVSSPGKSIRFSRRRSPFVVVRPIFGVPVPVAIVRALFIAIATIALCGSLLESAWLASIISMLVGLTGQVLGAMLFVAERTVKRVLAG
ncbi:MAG: hypothetical protein AB7Q81_12385 [Gammaproteobacteria bacterium]